MAKTGFHLSIKKLLLLGFLFVVLLVIPLTVYLVQQQQETRSQATPNTTMAFEPNAATAQVGDDVSFDIVLTPGNNQVSFVKLVIKFDPTKIKATDNSFLVDPNSNLSILQGPVVGTDTISVSLQLSGIDTTKVIRTPTKIGTITFNVIDGPAENSQITFSPATEIRSINGDSDAFNENVFLSGSPASITITDGDGTTDTELSPSPTIGQTDGSEDNEAPVCNNLTLTGPATGEAPYAVGLIVNGSDSDGTLRNFKFTFDDNEVENIASTSSEAKNTATVTSSMYTYETADTYTVTAVITDDKGGTSDSVACTKTITVTDADDSQANSENTNSNSTTNNTATTNSTNDDDDSDGTGGAENSDENSTADDDNSDENSTELTTTEVSPSPMPATGPTETIMGIGVLGGILLLIGTLLFFAL